VPVPSITIEEIHTPKDLGEEEQLTSLIQCTGSLRVIGILAQPGIRVGLARMAGAGVFVGRNCGLVGVGRTDRAG